MATGFDTFGETVRDWLEEPDNDEAELECLLLAASDDYESSQDPAQQRSAHAQEVNTASHSHSRFAPPKQRWGDKAVKSSSCPGENQARHEILCKWMGSLEEWETEKTNQTIPPLAQMNDTELNTWLSYFAFEVRKQNSLEYPPNSLYHIFAGLQRHIREEGRHQPSQWHRVRPISSHIRWRVEKAPVTGDWHPQEVVTVEEEDLLWEMGQLGDANP
jgi:hypothetical protein